MKTKPAKKREQLKPQETAAETTVGTELTETDLAEATKATEAKESPETEVPAEAAKQPTKFFTRKRIFLGVIVAVLLTAIAFGLGYILALQNNWFGLNEGTLVVKISVEGEDQDDYLDTIKLSVNGEQAALSSDLSFSKKLVAGTVDLEISGENYLNESAQLTLSRGTTTTYEFVLAPTATISIKVKDFLSGEDLTGFKVRWNEKDYVAEGAELKIQDLQLDSSAAKPMQISKDGFISRSRTIPGSLKQGLNEFHDNSLVQTGRFYYVSNSEGSSSIYSANYDGSDKKKLTDNKGNDYAPQYVAADNKVYFLSNRAKVKNNYDNVMDFAYSINPDGSGLTRVTTGDYKDNGSIGEYSFYSKMRTFVEYDSNYARYFLYYGPLTGKSMTKVETVHSGYPSNASISHHGKYLVYSQVEMDNSQKLHLYDIASKKNSTLLQTSKNEGLSVADISKDSKYVLVYVSSNSDNNDLWKVSLEGKKKLTNDLNNQSLASFLPNSQGISYVVSLDEKPSLFTRDLEGNNERKWSGDQPVSAYTWVTSNILLFKGEKGIYITKNAAAPKKIMDSAVDTTFETRYGYYD
jgi:Tol biopolymer transport system component